MKDFFNKERLRLIISIVLSFLICLGLFFTAVLADILVFSSPSFIVNSAKKSNYPDFAVKQITEELNDLAIPSGLPEDFFTGKIDKKAFSKIFYSCTENLASGNKDYKLNVEDFKTEIYTLVADYSKNEAGDFSSEVENDIKNFSTECANIYLSYVNPSLTSYVLELFSSAKNYIVIALAVSVVFTLIVGVVLFKLNHVKRFIKYCYASVMGSALTIGVIPSYLLITNEISRISISSKSLFVLVTTLAEQFLWVMVVSAVILVLVAIAMISTKIFNLIFKK